MNVYDFDGTIYKGDSAVDFFFYLLKKKPKIMLTLPSFFVSVVKYKAGKISKTMMKQVFYSHLSYLKKGEIDRYVKEFWKTHSGNIFLYYQKQKKKTDIIISASPSYLLSHISKKLGVKELIASEVDKNTGIYDGLNCYGDEKVKRFYKRFPKYKNYKKPIDNFYTDSKSDLPLAKISKNAYIVDKDGNVKKMSWTI